MCCRSFLKQLSYHKCVRYSNFYFEFVCFESRSHLCFAIWPKDKIEESKEIKIIINEETFKDDKMIIKMKSLKVRTNEFKMMKLEYTKYKIIVEDFAEVGIINREG